MSEKITRTELEARTLTVAEILTKLSGCDLAAPVVLRDFMQPATFLGEADVIRCRHVISADIRNDGVLMLRCGEPFYWPKESGE